MSRFSRPCARTLPSFSTCLSCKSLVQSIVVEACANECRSNRPAISKVFKRLASFSDLFNELVLQIESFLPRPFDIMYLAGINCQTYNLIGPLLYEYIALTPRSYRRQGQNRTSHNLLLLRNVALLVRPLSKSKNNAAVRRVNIDSSSAKSSQNVYTVLTALPSLRTVSLRMRRSEWRKQLFDVGLFELALRSATHTLRTLTLDVVGPRAAKNTVPISNLRHLSVLRLLCVQSDLLLYPCLPGCITIDMYIVPKKMCL